MPCLCRERATPVARHRLRSIASSNVRSFLLGGGRGGTPVLNGLGCRCHRHFTCPTTVARCGTIWDSGRSMSELAQLALVRYPTALCVCSAATQDLETAQPPFP